MLGRNLDFRSMQSPQMTQNGMLLCWYVIIRHNEKIGVVTFRTLELPGYLHVVRPWSVRTDVNIWATTYAQIQKPPRLPDPGTIGKVKR
jgi:hypothetical protein